MTDTPTKGLPPWQVLIEHLARDWWREYDALVANATTAPVDRVAWLTAKLADLIQLRSR